MPHALIGKLIRSSSHIDFACQVYGAGEVASPPNSADFAFGTFVRMAIQGLGPGWLIGLIYNTILLNPEFGTLGPRLSPAPALQVFSPDYLSERITLIGVLALGTMSVDGQVKQGVPAIVPPLDVMVERMTDAEIRDFHAGGSGVRLAYVPIVLGQQNPLAFPLLLETLDRVEQLLPGQAARLAVLRLQLAWQAQIKPLS